MRVIIIAVGRIKRGPESELAARYRDRAAKAGRAIGIRTIDIIEVAESRARDADRRMIEESIAITQLIPEDARVALLDRKGENLSTTAITDALKSWRDGSSQTTAFIVGGPDGLASSLNNRADLRVAFGAATWPHQLVRVMLLEQLYRAVTILSGHPYHRA